MDTRVTGGFWKDYQELVRTEVIPYQWKALNDQLADTPPSHAIENFKICAGISEGDYYGEVFQDSDVGKWIEACAYSLRNVSDPDLEAKVDSVVEILAKAQLSDGYLNTYYQLKAGIENRFTNVRDNHELYCAGHLLEAAVAYYEATGKDEFLKIMRRYVDCIGRHFGPEEGKIHGYPGHPELELALVRLFEATGERAYLDLACYFVNERGTKPSFYEVEAARRGDTEPYKRDLEYSQAHKPVREQDKAVGHAVRAVYLYTAMAGIARHTADESLRRACDVLWDDVTNCQMYVTGGIGSIAHGEAFTFDYDLPNDLMYNETCASIGLVFWARRMREMRRDSRYGDVIERALYNGILDGMALDGKSFFYVNPMEVVPAESTRHDKRHVKPRRQKWFGTACCPPNLARTVSSVGDYALEQDGRDIYVDLYMGLESYLSVDGTGVRLASETRYPWDGRVELTLTADAEVSVDLHLRVPSWCRSYELEVNGVASEVEERDGYVVVRLSGRCAAVVLKLEMRPERVYANERVRFDAHRVCLQRGPIVYAIEQQENGELLDSLAIEPDAPIAEEPARGLPEGTVGLSVAGVRARRGGSELYGFSRPVVEPVTVHAVPYFMWGNREPGEMRVWLHELEGGCAGASA